MAQSLYYSLGYYSERQLRQFGELICLPDVGTLSPSDLRSELVAYFLTREVMERVFNELEPVDRAYLSEILHSKNYLSLETFEVRYENRPSIYRFGNRHVCTMRLFADRNQIHTEVRDIAWQFIAPPPVVYLKTSKAPKNATIRSTESDALNDLLLLLNAIAAGRLPVTEKANLLGAAAVKEIAQIIRRGDFYTPEECDPIKSFAWTTFLQISGLCMVRERKMVLNDAGSKQLLAPVAESLKSIWNRWVVQSEFEELKRLSSLKHDSSAARRFNSYHDAKPRRLSVEAALAECPLNAWIKVDDFFDFIRKSGRHFSACSSDYGLLLLGQPVGSPEIRLTKHWNHIYGRYVLCFLMEYAATLGLIDVAYVAPENARDDMPQFDHAEAAPTALSRYDGLLAFRLNPLGAYILGKTETYTAPNTMAASKLTALSSMRLTFADEPLAEQAILLDLFAERESSTTWHLSKERALDAAQRGYPLSMLREFIAKHDDQPLPETVDAFLELTERNSQALQSSEPALLIECVNSEIAKKIADHQLTSKYAILAGDKHLVVRKRNDTSFRKAVNALGYGFALKD